MPLLIDTSVFVEQERRRVPLAEVFRMLPLGERVGLSVITLSELLVGVHLGTPASRAAQRQASIESLIRRIAILDFDALAARAHAEIWAHLRRAGALIGPHDMIIAATARSNGYDLLTANVREFSRVPGLTVVAPSW